MEIWKFEIPGNLESNFRNWNWSRSFNASWQVLQTGVAPPTINYNTPDPECDLNYVPNTKQDIGAPKAAISDNLGFGGHNAALCFKAYDAA